MLISLYKLLRGFEWSIETKGLWRSQQKLHEGTPGGKPCACRQLAAGYPSRARYLLPIILFERRSVHTTPLAAFTKIQNERGPKLKASYRARSGCISVALS